MSSVESTKLATQYRYFEPLDGLLHQFCEKHGFVLEKNTYHTPCRVLRKKGKVEFMIDLFQVNDWRQVTPLTNLTYSLSIVGHWQPPETPTRLFRLVDDLAVNVSLAVIATDLPQYLAKGLQYWHTWTPEVIEAKGLRIEGYGTGKVQW